MVLPNPDNRLAEVGLVSNVEGLSTELQLGLAENLEVLEHRHVPVTVVRSVELVTTLRSKRAC